MTWLTLEQFFALDKKCSRCDRQAKWVASLDSPAYCEEHFPYFDIEKSKISGIDDHMKSES